MTNRYILRRALHPSPPLHHLGVLYLLLLCVVLQELTVSIREFLPERLFKAHQGKEESDADPPASTYTYSADLLGLLDKRRLQPRYQSSQEVARGSRRGEHSLHASPANPGSPHRLLRA